MFPRFRSGVPVFLLMLVALGSTASESMAQTARQLVTQVIDERQTVELAGKTRPEVSAGGDRERVEDTLILERMQLLLKRPAEREAALVRFIDQLHDSKSPYFQAIRRPTAPVRVGTLPPVSARPTSPIW
ncbi:hypothetical protein P3T22_000802 [Paraburkholderia sp. GAS348]